MSASSLIRNAELSLHLAPAIRALNFMDTPFPKLSLVTWFSLRTDLISLTSQKHKPILAGEPGVSRIATVDRRASVLGHNFVA